MLNRNVIIILSLLLSACSSSTSWQNPFSGSFSGGSKTYNWSAGEVLGNQISYYWLTTTDTAPQTASDHVKQANGAWYETSYQWKDNVLNELVRKGVELQDNGRLANFEVNIRYSNDGEPVYQRYKIDNRILPLTPWNLNYYTQEAERVKKYVMGFKSKNYKLFQGHWETRQFSTCDGEQVSNLQYNKNISEEDIAKVDGTNGYMAFIGKLSANQKNIRVESFLNTNAGAVVEECVKRPLLIE